MSFGQPLAGDMAVGKFIRKGNNKMSQAKVDKYKEEKRNRKKTVKRQKRTSIIVTTIVIVVVVALILTVLFSIINSIIG